MIHTHSNHPISELKKRDNHALMQVTLARRPGDLPVVNARVVNVYTGEV